MPQIDVVVESPIDRTFRVEQAAGMFDLKVEEKTRESFSVYLPEVGEDWSIGAIVGPSGSGKTTIARAAYGERLASTFDWPAEKSVLDGFEEKYSIKHVVGLLNAVGFSSPPSWLKPFHVLSNGEKFRCELARALLSDSHLVVFDEFTSVVDRTVAKIGSAAVQKAIRKGNLNKKFVAVACHYDILDWLEPDWVLDMASGQLARGRLRRPAIDLEIAPIHRSAWLLFRRHHYLNTDLSVTAKCFCAFWGSEPVAFSAWLYDHSRGKDQWREHRTVVLPDYQGVGIGNRVSEFCASLFTAAGKQAYSTTSHPAMIGYRMASPKWQKVTFKMRMPGGKNWARRLDGSSSVSAGRYTGSFRYVGQPADKGVSQAFLAAVPKMFVPTESEAKVLEEIRKYPGATSRLIARQAGTTISGTVKILDRLVEAEMVSRSGSGGGGGKQFSFSLKN